MTPRPPMTLADIGRRVALTDDDLAIIERVRSVKPYGEHLVSIPGDDVSCDARQLLDYLLNGET